MAFPCLLVRPPPILKTKGLLLGVLLVELCSIFIKYPATAGYFLQQIGALLHTHDGPLGPFMGTS
jgi:hypothetical protein